MKFYKQLDPAWSTYTLGKTDLTIGRWGCTITSICMGRSRLYPKEKFTPATASKTFKFTKEGLLIHKQDYPGFKFHKRMWRWNSDKVEDWVRSKERFAVIAVNGNSHFVFAYYTGWFGVYIVDPLDGKIKRLNKHYVPCGAILYTKD